MAYSEQTFTPSGTYGTQIQGLIGTALVANGWVQVYTVTVSTAVYYVYKSPAGSNLAGVDIFFATKITSPTSGMTSTVFENWDAGTNLASAYIPSTVQQVPTVGVGTCPVATSPAVAISASNIAWFCSTTYAAAISNTLVLNVTPNRIIYSQFATGSQSSFYAGLYIPFQGIYGGTPLMITSLDAASVTNSSSAGGMTREGITTGTGNYNWRCLKFGSLASATTSVQQSSVILGGYISAAGQLSRNYPTGTYPTYRVGIVSGSLIELTGANGEGYQGALYDVVNNFNASFSALGGDTLAVTAQGSGTVYNYIKAQTSSANLLACWIPKQ
jgi:hypothetical protein